MINLLSIAASLITSTAPMDASQCDIAKAHIENAYSGICYKPLTAEEKNALHVQFVDCLESDIAELFTIAFYAYQAGEMDDMFDIFDAIESHMRIRDYAKTWRKLLDCNIKNNFDPLPNEYRFE